MGNARRSIDAIGDPPDGMMICRRFMTKENPHGWVDIYLHNVQRKLIHHKGVCFTAEAMTSFEKFKEVEDRRQGWTELRKKAQAESEAKSLAKKSRSRKRSAKGPMPAGGCDADGVDRQ